jgi:hypothetical protein
LEQGRRFRIQIDKDESGPFLGANGSEAKILLAKILYSFTLRRIQKIAIEGICPAMITTAKNFAFTAALGRRAGAVLADVIETFDFTVSIADDE